MGLNTYVELEVQVDIESGRNQLLAMFCVMENPRGQKYRRQPWNFCSATVIMNTDIPSVDIWDCLFERKEKPFPDDHSMYNFNISTLSAPY